MKKGIIMLLLFSMFALSACGGGGGGGGGGAIAVAADKAVALADGTSPITVSATVTPAVLDNTDVTFTITSGSAKFAGGATTVTAKTVNSRATAAVTSTAAGDNIISMSTASVGSNTTTVKFALPATAVVEVGLKNSYSNVFFFAFKLAAIPTSAVPTSPTVAAINEAAGLAGTGSILPLVDYTGGIATINLLKNASTSPGFSMVANSPVVRLTYAVAGGAIPTFAVSVSPPNPLGLTDLSDPSGAALPPSSPVTASDFVVTTTYKDGNGNVL